MKGSMRQRGSAWELRVYLGADPVNGKQRYATKTVRAGKREAQRSLNELIVEAERGLATRTTATVGELLDRWLELAREDFSPKTTREVIGYIERNLRPALGDVRLSKLTTASLDRYYRSLLVDGGRNGRPLAPGTIRRIHGILRRALAQGVRWGWLGVNPAASASPSRVPRPDIAPPTPTELGRLQAAIDVKDPEFGVFVRLSAMTGARRSEMLALRWPDIDLERGVVTIGRGSCRVRTGSWRRTPRPIRRDGSRSTRQRLPHWWITGWPPSGEPSSAAQRSPSTRSCSRPTSPVRRRGTPDSASRRFRKACDDAGLTGVRLHDLRHYVATRLLSAGVDVRTVAGRLGHRNAATTLNVYSRFVPEDDHEAAQILG